MSTDQSYTKAQHWKTLEEEIAENSFYPLDKTQQDQLFPLLRLLFAMGLEGLSLWVLCLSSAGREWMRSNYSMILHPAELGTHSLDALLPSNKFGKISFSFSRISD